MVSLPKDLSDLVQAKLSTGAYQSEEAVLHAALEALADREAADMASIQRGLAQADAGEGVRAKVAIASLRQKHGLSE